MPFFTDNLPERHPREEVIQNAEREFAELMMGFISKYSLSPSERLLVMAEYELGQVRGYVSAERRKAQVPRIPLLTKVTYKYLDREGEAYFVIKKAAIQGQYKVGQEFTTTEQSSFVVGKRAVVISMKPYVPTEHEAEAFKR